MIHHLLKLVSGGLITVAGINGAPLMIEPSGRSLGGARSINPWLKPRGNTLTIYLAQPPVARNVTLPPAQARAEVYSLVPDSPTNARAATLAKFERKTGDPTPLPVSREIPFEITVPPPAKLWAEAEKLTGLLSADKQQMKALVQKLAEGIDRRSLDDLLPLLDYKIKDCALAEGQTPEEMKQSTRELYSGQMFAEPSLKVDAAQVNNLEFKLIAGGQVVWIFQSLSKPALVVESPNNRFTFTVFAARIDHVWRIVR
jgi:hypothetical protein